MAKFETIPKTLRTPELEKLFAENEVTICACYCDGNPGSCHRRDHGAGFVHIGSSKMNIPKQFCYRLAAVKEAL